MTTPNMTLTSFLKMNTKPVSGVLETRTEVSLRRRGNPFGKVFAVTKTNVILNGDYEAAVNAQRAIEGKAQDFKAGQRVWGKQVSPAIVERDGKQYLSAIIESVRSVTYVTETGVKVERDAIKHLFKAKRKTANKQGLDDVVIFRNINFDNIEKFILKGDLVMVLTK